MTKVFNEIEVQNNMDDKKALEASDEHHKLKDSVFNQENSDKIAALEKAREDDLNRKEIEKQKAINAEKERINKIIVYISVAAFIILIIVLIIIYRLLKRSDKLLYNVHFCTQKINKV